MNFKVWLLTGLLVAQFDADAQLQDAITHFLRNGRTREWSDFPAIVKDSQLVVHFDMKNDRGAGTLSLIQFDVNQTWKVMLNDMHLGNLTLDEKKMTTYFDFPAGLLRAKRNTLKIVPEPVKTNRTDDISVGNLSVIPSPSATLLSGVPVNIRVVDKKNEFLPSRLTIVDKNGALQPVTAKSGDTMTIRTGVIYSSSGVFTFSLPAGSYKVYASRGFEYGVDSMSLDALAGDMIFRKLTVEHEIILPKWKSMDTHIHTLEFSGHGDASMNDRILTIAGEGLDYAVITEHNKAIDIAGTVKNKGLDKWFTPITGDEMTTPVGHFNVFPSDPGHVPDHEVKSWKEVKQNIEKLPGKKVVILNHARDVHTGIRPSDSLLTRTASALPVNAMEVMNSGSQQADPRQLYMDWLGLMKKGIFLAPAGASDSHDVSRFIVGQSRTYVPSDGDIADNFLKGRVGVSFGLFTGLQVDTVVSDGKLNVLIKVYAPSWITPANVALYANGQKIFSDSLSNKDKQAGHYFLKELSLATPPQGTRLVAVAEGPDPKVPWWPVARPYSWTSPDVTPIVLGISSCITP
ncbi:MAG: CehA/McbA family metallohydrolase [Chitinophagaceae bacterium]|nr:CehA/McbA family metallohydrolase [Chitinophagaceae bacterium]